MQKLISNVYFAYLVVILNIVFSVGTFTSLMIQQLHYTNEISSLRTQYTELHRTVSDNTELIKYSKNKIDQIYKQHR